MDIPRTPKWKRRLRQGMIVGAIALGGVVFGGWLVQARSDATFRAEHPPPGVFVDLGGRQIHFREQGDGDVTFVLEPGLGDYSGTWGEFERTLAKLGRVVVYDRAGLGWSEASPLERTASNIVTDLHRVLETAHVPKPYILVGHSLGGLTQTLYALRYPEDVAGLLLIDPAHKDQREKLPSPPVVLTFLMTQLSRTAGLGWPQFVHSGPDPVVDQARHVRTAGAELRSFLSSGNSWTEGAIELGDIPIYVLTAGDFTRAPGDTEEERKAAWESWRSLHESLIAASTSPIRRHIVVSGASHYIYQTNPEAVVTAARELVERIRGPNRRP